MKKLLPLAVSIAALAVTGAASAATLDDVKARGVLKCGVPSGSAGFATPDDAGVWTGFDVEGCRAVAAAVLGDSDAVEFTPTTATTRWEFLKSGEIDLLVRQSTWTLTRDVDLGFNFAGVNFYDGQGFMINTVKNADLEVKSALDLDGLSVCVQKGTTTENNLSEYFKLNGMEYELVNITTQNEGQQSLEAGRCDIYTTDSSALASIRSAMSAPDEYTILPEIISKEPLGPVVRHGDDQWFDIVKWTFTAMVQAEELGLTAANAAEMGADPKNVAAQKMLGTNDAGLGAMLGLENDWAMNIVTQVGNYGEVFERNVGLNTPLKLERGQNALWTNGGLQYAIPVK